MPALPPAGHFLELAFGVRHLELGGWHAHNEWVRYIGRGACVACFHCEPVLPNAVALPPPQIDYSPLLQQDWLRQELQELAKVPPWRASLLERSRIADLSWIARRNLTEILCFRGFALCRRYMQL